MIVLQTEFIGMHIAIFVGFCVGWIVGRPRAKPPSLLFMKGWVLVFLFGVVIAHGLNTWFKILDAVTLADHLFNSVLLATFGMLFATPAYFVGCAVRLGLVAAFHKAQQRQRGPQ